MGKKKKEKQESNTIVESVVIKHPGGRPRATDPAKNGRTVYLTDEELEKVLPHISRISFSVFVKQLLEEKGIL